MKKNIKKVNSAREEYYSARTRLEMAREDLENMIKNKSFDSNVSGIPCGIVVTGYDDDEIDFIILDSSGNRNKWLEYKCTDADTARIEKEITEWIEDGQYE